jgi:hypothetical protein
MPTLPYSQDLIFMPPKAFLLIALLAPHTAAAFGDLDCVTVGQPQGDTFAPDVIRFSITFQWDTEQATVSVAGEPSQTLDQFDLYDADGVQKLRYALNMDYGLTVTANADGINAMCGDHIDGLGYVGVCDVRQAA